jgi:protein arginine kinase
MTKPQDNSCKTAGQSIALSTRVRFARNIKGIPFPSKCNEAQRSKIMDLCKSAMFNMRNSADFSFYNLNTKPSYEKEKLAQQHLISPQLAQETRPCGLILSKDYRQSAMINEEDHLRIQSIVEGFEPHLALSLAGNLERDLGETLNYAFDKSFGYLTCCPTNLGNGMRISVMLHLPVLTYYSDMERIIHIMKQNGLVVRGAYGEGSYAENNVYQVSNKGILGLSIPQEIERLTHGVKWLISQECQLII